MSNNISEITVETSIAVVHEPSEPKPVKLSRSYRWPSQRDQLKRLNLKRGEVSGKGLDSCLPGLAIRTQEEVAEIMGFSRQYVAQLERRAFLKLRRALGSFKRELLDEC